MGKHKSIKKSVNEGLSSSDIKTATQTIKKYVRELGKDANGTSNEVATKISKILGWTGSKIDQLEDYLTDLNSGSDTIMFTEARTSTISKKRAGAELKQKLKGTRSDGMGKYTATIYGLDKDGKRIELKSMNDLNKYSKFELGKLINEGKGAKNYFDDLKFNYTKSLRYLDKDEKKEYNKLAKDFFSKISESLVNEILSKEDRLKIAKSSLVKAEKNGDDKLKKRALATIEVIKKESVDEGSRMKVNENTNPEIYKSVDRFIKALATKYGYEDEDAVFVIQAALKEREYNVDVFGDESINEDMDLGHKDNEPHMLKKDLYRIAKYAAGLYKMVNQYDSKKIEVDFPHWWQSKIIQAKTMLVSAKHYLDGELTIPQIDDALGEALDFNDPVLVARRAGQMRTDKILSQPQGDFGKEYGDAVVKARSSNNNDTKLRFLKKERDQLMMDMEQEAEPEGGPIADRYGAQLNRIDKAIAKLSGRKEMTYDQAIK